MTDKLPPNLLALFAPRPALRYLAPIDHAPEERHTPHIGGVGQWLDALKEYKEDDDFEPTESWLQRRDRLKLEKKEKEKKILTEGIKDFKPQEDPNIRGDAFKTLFVSRLSYDADENDIEREFGRFGAIERIRIVKNTHKKEKSSKKKHRGYAFVVFEREKDMKAAYKETDGVRIKDRRVVVDVERGRTVSGWRPRRFGGGLGGRGLAKGPPARPAGPQFGPPGGPGGFRGGFGGFRGRGGFRGGFGDRGGFRGGYGGQGGGRGGIGYQQNGFGAPEGAPSGPRGPRSGGYGSGGHGGRYGGGGGGGGGGPHDGSGGGYGDRNGSRYDDRSYKGSGSNREPVGYRDRDRDGGYGRDEPRKRPYDGGNYDDPRQRRRY